MIGRGAIRNPWIFEEIRAALAGRPMPPRRGRDFLRYVEALYESVAGSFRRTEHHVHGIKKYLNFVGNGLEPTGAFLHRIQRVSTEAELFAVCRDYLDHDRPVVLSASQPLQGRVNPEVASVLSSDDPGS